MLIHAFSDSHNRHKKIENQFTGGDLLLCAGDFSFHGYKSEYEDFITFMSKMKSRYDAVVTICGNHEEEIERKHHAEFVKFCQEQGVVYLEDSGFEYKGVKIWGSPVTPWFFDWGWNRSIRDDNMVYSPPRFGGGGAVFKMVPHIKPHWDKIPADTNILLTHGPAYGILDELVFVDGTPKGEHVGCPHLLEKIKLIRPHIHISGHIHCGYGQKHIDGTSYYNVAVCDEMYYPGNPVTVIEYDKENG